MSRNLFMKVLVAAAVPMTGLAYLAATELEPGVTPIAHAPAPTPRSASSPVAESADEETTLNVLDLPVYVEARWQPAPAPKVEAMEPQPPPMPTIREVMAGQAARQLRASFVRMWGGHQSDTIIESSRRSPSALSRHYRSADEQPNFERVGVPGVSADMAKKD